MKLSSSGGNELTAALSLTEKSVVIIEWGSVFFIWTEYFPSVYNFKIWRIDKQNELKTEHTYIDMKFYRVQTK